MVFGGIRISLTPQWMLDISARHEDLGEVGTDRGGVYMDHINGEIEIAKTNADPRGFGLMMGMRYLFRTSLRMGREKEFSESGTESKGLGIRSRDHVLVYPSRNALQAVVTFR